MGNVVAWIAALGSVGLVGLWILSKFVNSINNSVPKAPGTTQPTDLDRGLTKAKRPSTMQAGERALLVGPAAKTGGVEGVLVLTDRRLRFEPRGASHTWECALQDVSKVVNLIDTSGFAVDHGPCTRTMFIAGRNDDWYDQVLAAANDPAIRRLRLPKTVAAVTPRPQGSLDAVVISFAPMRRGGTSVEA